MIRKKLEDIQDIEAHLKGGIPEADIDALSPYWEICPTLRHSIIKKGQRKGYCQLTIGNDDIKKTILSHPEFEAFRKKVMATFSKWQKASTEFLKDISTKDHPKAIIKKISDDLLSAYAITPSY